MKAVLYVEDDDNDLLFFRTALQRAGRNEPLYVCRDGQEAVDFLARYGTNPKAESEENLLCLVIVDLNLPKKSGFEVLQWIRQKSRLFTIPVVAFSGSNHSSDMHRTYALGANAYLVKPSNSERMLNVVRITYDFWLGQNEVPPDGLTIHENERNAFRKSEVLSV
jgi:CheY-like chemotaxis protein